MDKSNTCKDETPSQSRPGWVWSCEACNTQEEFSLEVADRESSEETGINRRTVSLESMPMEPESLESTESESSEKNGKTGSLAQTCFDKHFMNGQVMKPCHRWLRVQRKPEPHKPEGRVQVPG